MFAIIKIITLYLTIIGMHFSIWFDMQAERALWNQRQNTGENKTMADLNNLLNTQTLKHTLSPNVNLPDKKWMSRGFFFCIYEK